MKKPIFLQLLHPDAHFYDLLGGPSGVIGMFEGETIEEFNDVSAYEFLWAAQRIDLIYEYDESHVLTRPGDEGHGMKAANYICQIIEDSISANAILREVFRARLASKLQGIKKAINATFPDEKIYASVDATFCSAAMNLAEIISVLNPEWATAQAH